MRVAVRRTRALLRAGETLLATDTSSLADGLQALGRVLGDVRDLDVLIEHLDRQAAALEEPDASEAKTLVRALCHQRSARRRALLKTLDSEEYFALLDDFGATLDALEPAGASETLDELAARAAKKLRRAVAKLPEEPTDAELHEIRKLGKRTRYAAELAGQDAVVAEQRLRALAEHAQPGQALAAGRLVEWDRGRKLRARKDWPKAWKKLRKKI
jgi:CHAD domain-containing protein